MTFEKVSRIIAENRDIDENKIKSDTTLEELGFDALDTEELVMSLEDEFGISLDFDDGIVTVADVIKLIDESK